MNEPLGHSAISEGLQGCPVCTKVLAAQDTHCELCGARLHGGWGRSIQNTWAWLLTSVVLYIPANILPIMRTRFLGEETGNTILGGVLVLWEHGSYPIAAVIFIASIVVPLGKMIVLGYLCLSVQFHSSYSPVQRTRLYRVTEIVGRWSMVDVFVVAILVALIQLGNVMSIYPGMAALAFAVMVITTMIAAIAFDPRLLWMSINKDTSI